MIHLEQTKEGLTTVKPLFSSLDYSTAPELRRELESLIEDRAGHIILDLDAVNFVDSSGLAAILKARAALAGGGKLVVCRANLRVTAAFRLSRMDRAVTLTETLAQALAELDRP